MSKLWDKGYAQGYAQGYALDRLVERYTVGEDYLLDHRLVTADCLASMAHAAMLAKIGILEERELRDLRRELAEIARLNRRGKFPIRVEDEDCHTAIENRLVARLGEAGLKIHTGRSRNDQVIAALRLYARSFLLELTLEIVDLAGELLRFAGAHRELPMPGRTHLQVAMPSSVGLWAAAYGEELLDDLELVDTAYRLNDSCPLGSAASYGVPLPLDREMVARALGFARVQNNVLYVNNSRGKVEAVILDALHQVMLTLSRLCQDLILFSLPELGYFSLPEELFAGSSIMPQKRNPCLLETVRATTATVGACAGQVKEIIRALPSGYNRDFQETKAAFFRGTDATLDSVCIVRLVVQKLVPNREALLRAFTPEIFATDRALELVQQGMPFREAYREVGRNLAALEKRDPVEAIRRRSYTGTTGNLGLEAAEELAARRRAEAETRRGAIRERIVALAGEELPPYEPPGSGS
jgi:argininosuccinate lyase